MSPSGKLVHLRLTTTIFKSRKAPTAPTSAHVPNPFSFVVQVKGS